VSEDLLLTLILVAIAVVLIAGFWLTRSARRDGRLPGMTARDALMGLPPDRRPDEPERDQ
jgi:hypothetical protein